MGLATGRRDFRPLLVRGADLSYTAVAEELEFHIVKKGNTKWLSRFDD